MGYFGGLIDDFGSRFKDFDVTQAASRDAAKLFINRAYKWIYCSHPWEWRFKTGQTTLIPNYETGTCSVTQYNGTNEAAAREVTFSGATLSAAMKGRFFKPDGEDSYHKIMQVDGSTIYLETPILRATASGLTFDIWKRFYYLPGEVAAITDFGKWNSRWGRLEYRSFSNLVDRTWDITNDGEAETFSPFGVDQFQTVYATGQISGTEDSNVLTGSGGAAFLGNVLPGDEIITSDKPFTVKRAETGTQLILNNYLPNALPASSYEIRRNLSVGFQFHPNEMDEYKTVPYYYYDRAFDMIHEEKDRPNLPDDFDDAIITRAEFKFRKDKGWADWASIAQLFIKELDDLKINFRVARPRYDVFAPEVRGYPGRA